MESSNGMFLGGIDESGKCLNIEAIKRLPPQTKIGGKWKIYQCKSKILPKSRNLLLSLHLLDKMQHNKAHTDLNKLLECKIWKHPQTTSIPKKDDILIVKGQNATIKNFNQSNQINIDYKYVEYIQYDAYNNRQINTHQSSHHSSSECSDSRHSKTSSITIKSTAKTHRLSANNIAKHNQRTNRNYANSMIQHKRNPIQRSIQQSEASFIKQTIYNLFARTVHHFPQLKHISSQWPIANYSMASLNSPCFENNVFLRLLIEVMTKDNLQVKDPIDLYGRNGDALLDEMRCDTRERIKLLLKQERYEELPLFTKMVLQTVNGIIVKKNMNTKQKYVEHKLRAIYDKFPLRKDFEKFPSVVMYQILHSSLQITPRSDCVLNAEQQKYKHYGNKVQYTQKYAKYLTKFLCVLCFNSNVVLRYYLNAGFDGATFTHICNDCSAKIRCGMVYWKLYESMLHWDSGWKLLFSNECDQKYRCTVGIMCAILFRDAMHKTNLLES